MNINNDNVGFFKKKFLNSKYLEIEGGQILDGDIKISGAKKLCFSFNGSFNSN